MGGSAEFVWSLKSTREWSTALEEEDPAPGAETQEGDANSRRERIRCAARKGGLGTRERANRRVLVPLLQDLAAKEAQIADAIESQREEETPGSHPLNEGRALARNAKGIEESCVEVRAAMHNATGLPLLAGCGEEKLRVYEVARRFLEAAAFRFEKSELLAFLSVLQEQTELSNAELWALRGFLNLVLLESVARYARDSSCAGSGSGAGKSDGPANLVAILTSLHRLRLTNWKRVFGQASLCERALSEDPAGAYDGMDEATKRAYRQAAGEVARESRCSKSEVARRAVALAQARHDLADPRAAARRLHVGFYLLGDGRMMLEKSLSVKSSWLKGGREGLKRRADNLYLVGIELATLGLMSLVVMGGRGRAPSLFLVGLFLLPAAESAVAIVNQLVALFVEPMALPKMDFSAGIPAACKTLVVVPTLLTSRAQMKRAVRDLEVRFLGNRDANLHFALLTDPPDAPAQFDRRDALAVECAEAIEALNRQYSSGGKGSFFLFHRHRVFNAREGIWMGWERKRGKLLDLNNRLLGVRDNFSVTAGDRGLLQGVKYVITVDADTQLPRDAARKLTGAMAHPLNRAVIHPRRNIVVEGYGILQPRVSVSIHSANRSHLAAFFSGDSAFDVYTRAVSDVYQDLFGEGIFTGKGIYDVDIFNRVLQHRFPCNAILSHDMIEGSYARAGLVSDVEVVDDYPSRTAALSKRKHRWVRGDWQILFWLFPRVPDRFGNVVRNPLSLISRWKILDNLRRSLTDIAVLAILAASWVFFSRHALYWTLAVLGIYALPAYIPSVIGVLRSGRALLSLRFWRAWLADLSAASARLFLKLVCLPQQSMVALDAVVRTGIRLAITRRRLLEWETAADAENGARRGGPIDLYLRATPWAALAAGLLLALYRSDTFLIAWPLLALWVCSKAFCNWLDEPLLQDGLRIRTRDAALLRSAALRSWRFFSEFSDAKENWLVPDIFKEEGELLAHRVSPTNLGLLLNARIAALDLGHTTMPEFAAASENTLASVRGLPKAKGHLYNWYDTSTMEPVGDAFLSAVDSGNLVCCLWTLKQACLEELERPIFRKELWVGIGDHARVLLELSPARQVRRAVRAVERQIAREEEFSLRRVASLPDLAQAVNTLLQSVSSAKSADLPWWAAQMRTRVEQLQNLVVRFAPWASTRFRTLRASEEQKSRWIAGMSLASYDQIASEIEATLDAESAWPGKPYAAENLCRDLLREALAAAREAAAKAARSLREIAACADQLADGMDFSIMYDCRRELMTIGYDAARRSASDHHYDLLASEARAAVFVGVAKGEIPQEAWFRLNRSHVQAGGQRLLQSWTGTMFEYLMPSLWMKSSPGTLLDRSMARAVRVQQEHARRLSVPWGFSESACSIVSGDGHYHYFAFGVPALALHTSGEERVVVSPYSTFLSLMTGSCEALRNLRRLRKLGAAGPYGFYEALDYGPRDSVDARRPALVRSWMAHHQGMCLLAVANALCHSSIQRRFHAEPRVAATERILHERAFEPAPEKPARAKRPAAQPATRLKRKPLVWAGAASVLFGQIAPNGRSE